jgi:hypothetical protein
LNPDASQRLLRLEHILSQSKPAAAAASDGDPVKVHLSSVATDRIRQVTAELTCRNGVDNDEIDMVAMRVLLNDYSAAVAHFRAVARAADEQIAAAAGPISDVRRFLWQQRKLQEESQQALAEPPSQPSPRPTLDHSDGSST